MPITESVINTSLASLTAIVVALIGIAQVRQSKRTKDIQEQTVNSHRDKPNLRDDIDTIKDSLVSVSRDIGGLRAEQRQTRVELYDLRLYTEKTREYIDDLEKTLDTRKDS